MEQERKAELEVFLRTRIAQTDFLLRGNVVTPAGRQYPQRNAIVLCRKYVRDFLHHGSEPRWIIMPGLRGVGKTTLMAQVYLNELTEPGIRKFHLSVDVVVRRFGANLWDVMEAYEKLVGTRLEELTSPTFFFFDEVQYDASWDAAIKSFYDRSKNVFVLCTGSSATLLRKQLSGDSARRAFFLELYPMPFAEYWKLKTETLPVGGMAERVAEACLDSSNAAEAAEKLRSLESASDQYWSGVDDLEVDRYLKFGTMPFTLVIPDEAVVMNQLDQMLGKVLAIDIPQTSAFDKETLDKFAALVYVLADGSAPSLETLHRSIGPSPHVIADMLVALENSGIVMRIPAYGSNFTQAKKPYKHLFTSPAVRYLQLAGKYSIADFERFKGDLLEDVVGLYLRKWLARRQNTAMTYDAEEGGADFIVRVGTRPIVLEIGFGRKNARQAKTSMKKSAGAYGLVISEEPSVRIEGDVVFVPMKLFLLGA